jgi:hypothetical protein
VSPSGSLIHTKTPNGFDCTLREIEIQYIKENKIKKNVLRIHLLLAGFLQTDRFTGTTAYHFQSSINTNRKK